MLINDVKIPRLFENIFSILWGRGINLFLSFLIITLAARYLGVSKFGIFASIIALVYIFSKIIEQEFSLLLFRELSRSRSNYEILNLALSLRFVTFIVLLFPFNLILLLSNYTTLEVLLSNGIYLNIIISSKMINFRDLLEIPFKVEHKMNIVAVINTIDNLILLVFVVAIPYIQAGFEYLCVVYVISNLPGFILLLFKLYKHFSFSIKLLFQNAKWLIVESLPLWGFTILIGIYSQIDILILNQFQSSTAAGVYGAAARLTMPLGLLPVAIITTIFPLIVKNRREDPTKNSEIIRFVTKVLFIFSFIFAIVLSFKSKDLCILIFGEDFGDSYQPFILLLWANVFMFFNNFSLDLFAAYNIQKYNIFVALVVVVVNISILIFFVEDYSYNAAGGAKILATVTGSLLIMFLLSKNKLFKFKPRIKEFIWCVLISFSLYLLSYLPILVFIILSFIVIAITGYIFSIFTNAEYKFVKNLLGY